MKKEDEVKRKKKSIKPVEKEMPWRHKVHTNQDEHQ
jgi:hypothetical protein